MSFFLLLFALSIPFWIIGASTRLELLPGLPIAASMAICPGLGAIILRYREHGVGGALALLKRSLDFDRIKWRPWYLPVCFLMPLVALLSYGLMRWMGWDLPKPELTVLRVYDPRISGIILAAIAVVVGLRCRWGVRQGSFLSSVRI